VNAHGSLSDHSVNAHGSLSDHSVNAHGSLSDHSLQEGKGREGNIERKGKDRKGEDKTRARAKTSLPIDFAITPALQAWADQHDYGDMEHHLASFRDKAQAKGYQYVDWEAALRNAVRDDWAGIRKPAQARHHSTRQSREDAKLETFHKLTGGLAGRKNGEPSYENVIDITPSAVRVG